jgi:hypothetical protein
VKVTGGWQTGQRSSNQMMPRKNENRPVVQYK